MFNLFINETFSSIGGASTLDLKSLVSSSGYMNSFNRFTNETATFSFGGALTLNLNSLVSSL